MYRISTNGKKFIIERKKRFLFWTWWQKLGTLYDLHLPDRLGWGSSPQSVKQFDTAQAARDYIRKMDEQQRLERYSPVVMVEPEP